jgi:uncharacterized Zn finger protein (UPF0148 family)
MNCPKCGWELYETDGLGIWCVNPDCEVLEDYKNYLKEEKTISKALTKKKKRGEV